MSGFNISFVDLAVGAILLVSAGYAMYRGFVKETLSVFAWAAAAFATLYFGPSVAGYLHGRITPSWLGSVTGYAGVFLVVLLPLSYISYRFADSVKHSPVGTLDRALGAAFGIIRGFAIIGFAYFVFSSFVPVKSQPDWMAQAKTLPLIQSSSEVLLSLVPDHDKNAVAAADAQTDTTDAVMPKPRPLREADRSAPKRLPRKTYGAEDRRALDKLIETTGGGDKP
ncbi:MAG TPA: CvpA family protein [Rhizomicrobium sp.]|jgi:membrane protein required for colicin V production|nr:CvpA family protein [Rhizomicrobium sp.]